MKGIKRIIALLTSFILAISLMTGCGNSEKISTNVENSQPEAKATREITDMAGRKVNVPTAENIKSVFSSNPVSAIFIYMVDPDKLLGWNYKLNDIEKSIILEKYHNLPNFGMGDKINYENVISAKPTIAINCGKINDSMKSDCDNLSKKLGIPVIAVDSDLKNSANAFKFIGDLLGKQDHCKKLSDYADKTFKDISVLSNVPEKDKVKVYYGNGEDSLETAPKGSAHSQILDTISAINVADLELGDGARVRISPEQLLAWNPDVIVVNGEPKSNKSGGSAAEDIIKNPNYSKLKAVQNLKVYGTPNAPFSWIDRPPGPSRLIGIRWFSSIIYSDYLKSDLKKEVHEFFKLFYHIDLSDEQMNNLLKGTL